MNRNTLFRWSTISLVSIWLIVFALIPHLFILMNSILHVSETSTLQPLFTFKHYCTILLEPLYLKVFWRSFKLAIACTALCLMIAYPFAYSLTHVKTRYKPLLLLLIIIPFWTSSLIRTYAIISMLKAKGVLNSSLMALGLIQEPIQLLHTPIAVIIGLVYDLLPFMILPLYTSFEKLNPLYLDAARDLGANRFMILSHIILPLTLPGIFSGSLLVFLPAMSIFYIPDILGGSKSLLLGNLIQRQFLTNHWPFGAALSVMLIGILLLCLFLGYQLQKGRDFYQDFV